MLTSSVPAERPILVTTSKVAEAGLFRAAIEEVGRMPVLVQDTEEAMRLLCGGPHRFAAVVAAERAGRTSGFTLCGLARDAGCRLPMLLVTSDDCRWTAVRAARLRVSVLWQPVPAWRIAQTLLAMLPRRACGTGDEIKLPAWPRTAPPSDPRPVKAGAAPDGPWDTCRWRPTSSW